jgi:hypothetical protein
MNVSTLENADESILLYLFLNEQNWAYLISDLEKIAKNRIKQAGMERHHLEPERKEVIHLWTLEHLAIHICHAKLQPSDSYNAKVAAFVKAFPGGFRRLVSLSDPLHSYVLNLGQSRPSNKGKGNLQCIHQSKDEKGRSLVALKAAKISAKRRQIPVKVTNLMTGNTQVFPSVKDAAEATGILRQNLSSYLTGYITYLPRKVQGVYLYETAHQY